MQTAVTVSIRPHPKGMFWAPMNLQIQLEITKIQTKTRIKLRPTTTHHVDLAVNSNPHMIGYVMLSDITDIFCLV